MKHEDCNQPKPQSTSRNAFKKVSPQLNSQYATKLNIPLSHKNESKINSNNAWIWIWI